jgi:hypothetical protein
VSQNVHSKVKIIRRDLQLNNTKQNIYFMDQIFNVVPGIQDKNSLFEC